jgi:predicted transposase YdaD
MPDVFKNDKIFQKAFWIAELANFTPEERRLYELNLKRLRDTYAVLETYEMTGLARGRAEGIIEGRIEGKIEGKIEGRIEGKIEDLLMLFSQKLGPIPADVEAAIRALNHLEQVNSILAHFMKINDWEALRRYLVTPQ